MNIDGQLICPVCGQIEFGYENDFDTCPICKWTNDSWQAHNPDESGGANGISLNEHKKMWQEKQKNEAEGELPCE